MIKDFKIGGIERVKKILEEKIQIILMRKKRLGMFGITQRDQMLNKVLLDEILSLDLYDGNDFILDLVSKKF